MWEYKPNESLKRVQTRAMRCFLGVNRYAPIGGTEGDMGWVIAEVRRKVEMIRLWNHLLKMEDHRLPKLIYKHMLNTEHTWVTEIKEILTSVNAIHALQNNLPVLNFKIFAKYVTDNLMQQYENRWINQIIRTI